MDAPPPVPTTAPPRGELSLRPVVVGATLVMAAILALLVLAVWASYRQAVEESAARASFIALTTERGVTRTLEAVELALVGVADELRAGAGDLEPVRRRITDTLRFAPHIREIAVVRGTEILVASRRAAEGARVDLERLDLEATDGTALSLGLRLGANVPGRYLPLAGEATPGGHRHILAVAVPAPTAPQGGAQGGAQGGPVSVLAGLNPDYFEGLFQDAGVGQHGALRLMRADGRTLLEVGPAPAEPLPPGLGTRLGDQVAVDGAAGLTTFHLSSRYPAAVAVALSHRDTMARWTTSNRMVLLGLGGVTLVVLAAIALLGREVARRVRLQRQVRLLFSAVEQSSAVVLITDAQRRIEYVNPAFTSRFGYDPAHARGRDPSMLGSGLTPPETYVELWRSLETDGTWRGEFINRATDGSTRVMASTISRVADADGTVTHYIGVMDDISERKAMEAERERMIAALSRSNAEMARLTEVMSHHFQEPVRRLTTFAARLRTGLAEATRDPDNRMALEFIDSESRRLRNLVHDVQLWLAADVVRGDGATADAQAVAAVVAEEVARLGPQAEAAGGRIEVGPLPPVPLDAPRLRQLIGQLLNNALAHAGATTAPVVRISGELVPGAVRWRVEDNGPGVPEAYRERVFRLFEKLKASGTGTGIGLSIVRRIVESRGGRIWIEDASCGGAAVMFELPMEDSHEGS